MTSGAELIARATKIGAKLRARQDESDVRGCYSDEIHRELLEGGFYRILQPRMFNGGGWCYTLASSHALVAGAHLGRGIIDSNGDG